MWLIDRHSEGLRGARVPLPEPLRAALVRWYVGQGSRHDEDAGITLVQQARIGAKWIACDCLGSDQAPPILTPAFLSEAETYYLRRLTSPKRPEHVAHCPFFRDQVTNRITEVRSPHTPVDPPSGYFEVLRPAPEKLAQRPDEDTSDDRTRSASVPRLARLLGRLLSNAGLNVAPPQAAERSDREIGDEFRALARAAAQIEIAPCIELGRALWTHSQALHSKRAFAALRELARRWPHGHAPQGFLTVFAPEFKGATIYPPACAPLKIANRVQSSAVRDNPVTGPYLVIVVIGGYPETKGYAPLRAYAQPILSGNRFMPVETNFERDVLRGLLNARRLFDRASIDLLVEKPIFDQLTPIGAAKPDFLLEARSRLTGEIRRLAVQAMGGPGSSYLAAKESQRRIVEQIAPVIDITAQDIERGRLAQKLWAAFEGYPANVSPS